MKKVAKKPVKKPVKKPSKLPEVVVEAPTLELNKKNAQDFGRLLFSDEAGVVSFLKLCDSSLQRGKSGGRSLHCAVGEAYLTFAGQSLKPIIQLDRRKEPYDSKYSIDSEGSTAAAIDALVEVAVLKSNKPELRQKLAEALDDCMAANDDGEGDSALDPSVYTRRAKQVAKTWNKEVVPLLK